MRNPGSHLIVTGDFNDAATAMRALTGVHDLHHTESATRKDRALDMVVSDMEIEKEFTRNFPRSDHMALHTVLKTRHEIHWKYTTVPKRGKILKDLTKMRLFLTCPEDLRRPLKELMTKKHFKINKP